MDTHSHPGYLMLKLLGPGLGTGFGPAGGSSLKLAHYPPPWEIETSFIAPDDTIPWNYWMNFIVLDKNGKNLGMWTPGVENLTQGKEAPALSRGFAGDPFSAGGARANPGRQAGVDAHPVRRRISRAAGLPRSTDRALVHVRACRRQGEPWFRNRCIRHALLEHDHRSHVWRFTGWPDVSKDPGRLCPLSKRALENFRETSVAPLICIQLFTILPTLSQSASQSRRSASESASSFA